MQRHNLNIIIIVGGNLIRNNKKEKLARWMQQHSR